MLPDKPPHRRPRRQRPGREPRRARPVRALLAALTGLVMLLCGGCVVSTSRAVPTRPEPRDAGRLRVASFDFLENQVLAELYGQQLRRAGFAVDVLDGLGTREVVEPALEQGQVDIVVDYTGSLLDFLGGDVAQAHGPADAVHTAVAARLAAQGLTALRAAPAEDANGFAVTTAFAHEHGISRLSDLAGLAGRLTFGGPPECPTRRYCLRGLRDRYGLQFGAFRAQPSRVATVTALESGEIDVGLLETTDGSLGDGQLTLLVDDRGLQPRENLVPVVRTEVVRRYGAALTAPLDAVSGQLTNPALVALNRRVTVGVASPADVAADYLATVFP